MRDFSVEREKDDTKTHTVKHSSTYSTNLAAATPTQWRSSEPMDVDNRVRLFLNKATIPNNTSPILPGSGTTQIKLGVAEAISGISPRIHCHNRTT